MKNSIFNSLITAAAFSLAVGLSSHAAAEQILEQAGADGFAKMSNEQAHFGTIPSLDAAKTERVIVAGLRDSIEKLDVEVNIQAQNRAEVLYQRHNHSDSLPAPQPGLVYQSVAIAW